VTLFCFVCMCPPRPRERCTCRRIWPRASTSWPSAGHSPTTMTAPSGEDELAFQFIFSFIIIMIIIILIIIIILTTIVTTTRPPPSSSSSLSSPSPSPSPLASASQRPGGLRALRAGDLAKRLRPRCTPERGRGGAAGGPGRGDRALPFEQFLLCQRRPPCPAGDGPGGQGGWDNLPLLPPLYKTSIEVEGALCQPPRRLS
jgi:hypothetical protein